MDVELRDGLPDPVSQRAVQLAQALCADAHLYGGHACLGCQWAARQLVAESGGEDLVRRLADGASRTSGAELPPHGTSLRKAQAHWALVLSNIRNDVRLAAQENGSWDT